jgi:hypothetical protein
MRVGSEAQIGVDALRIRNTGLASWSAARSVNHEGRRLAHLARDRSSQSPRSGQGDPVGHGFDFFRRVAAGIGAPSAMVGRIRRQQTEVGLEQAAEGVTTPRGSEDDLDLGLGNIDIEIRLDGMLDRFLGPHSRRTPPGPGPKGPDTLPFPHAHRRSFSFANDLRRLFRGLAE